MFEQLAAPTLTQEQINEMTRPSQQFAMAMSSQQMMSAQEVKDKIVNPAQEMQEALADAAQAEQAVQEAVESLRPQMLLKQQEALYELRESMLQYQDFSQQMAAALDTEQLISGLFDPYPAPRSPAHSRSSSRPIDTKTQIDQSPAEWGLTNDVIFWISIASYRVNREIEQQGLDETISLGERLEWILRVTFYLHHFV